MVEGDRLGKAKDDMLKLLSHSVAEHPRHFAPASKKAVFRDLCKQVEEWVLTLTLTLALIG